MLHLWLWTLASCITTCHHIEVKVDEVLAMLRTFAPVVVRANRVMSYARLPPGLPPSPLAPLQPSTPLTLERDHLVYAIGGHTVIALVGSFCVMCVMLKFARLPSRTTLF